MITAPRRKILLIGWDAADWQVALPLVQAGKMPTLKRLMEQSAWGKLATLRPVLSPMLWTSIATGKRAWKHGIHGFSEPCPQTDGIRPISNLSRTSKAIWNIFNQNGLRSQVLGWWPSHPAEPINGVMVSNFFQQAVADLGKPWPLRPGTVHPKRLERDLAELRIHPAELENEHLLPFIPGASEIDQSSDRRLEMCAKILAEISSVHAAATATLQLEPWDFAAVYYDGIDHFGHGFMRYHPPRRPWVTEREFELYSGVIERAYRFHDMMLDVLLRIAGDETTVLLMSDHGFEPGDLRPQSLPNEPAGPASEHSPFGMFCLRAPGVRAGEQIHGATLLDIAPTLLHLAGLPAGRDMDGRVLVNCFVSPQTISLVDSWEDISGDTGQHPSGTGLDTHDARETLRQLVELGYIDEPNPDRAEAVAETARELRYNLAQAYVDAGRHVEAVTIFLELWDRWPGTSRFGTQLLFSYLALGEAALARSTFEKLLAQKKAASLRAQEILRQKTSEREAAEKAARAEAEAAGRPYVPPPLSGDETHALRRLRFQAGTDSHAVAFLEGSILALEGRLEEAVTVLRQVEGVQAANQPSLQNKLADIHLRLGDLDGAESACLKALAHQPDNPPALLNLARVMLKAGRPFEAVGHAKAAIDLGFSRAHAHALHGAALLALGKPGLAAKSLRTALALEPWHAEAHESLAEIFARRRNGGARATRHREQAALARQRAADYKAGLHTAGTASAALPEFPAVIERVSRLAPSDYAPLVVVSGLPRSGTSLMMQMLVAGGISAVADDHRGSDESNPRGYLEDDRVKRLPFTKDRVWLAESRGRAVKIVAPLLHCIPHDIPAKIVFLQRPPAELLASQRAMLARDGKPARSVTEEAGVARGFVELQLKVNKLLELRSKWELLPVSFHDAVHRPEETARRVAAFLGGSVDVAAMARAADPSLHRQRG